MTPHTIFHAASGPAELTGNILRDYAAAWLILLVTAIALLFTHFRRKDAEATPFSRIITRATKDGIPSVLAIALTAAIIALAVTRVPIPDFLSQAFLIVIGYYFGQQTRTTIAPSDDS